MCSIVLAFSKEGPGAFLAVLVERLFRSGRKGSSEDIEDIIFSATPEIKNAFISSGGYLRSRCLLCILPTPARASRLHRRRYLLSNRHARDRVRVLLPCPGCTGAFRDPQPGMRRECSRGEGEDKSVLLLDGPARPGSRYMSTSIPRLYRGISRSGDGNETGISEEQGLRYRSACNA